ncbi:MAG TPA: hypothetical protein VFG87_05960 [Amycolatopsis sp.]|jgi:hypothetical protein|nr:hypothetical protein [Amycolatopsis sp.]
MNASIARTTRQDRDRFLVEARGGHRTRAGVVDGGTVGVFSPELFGTSMRCTGSSLAFQFAGIFGGRAGAEHRDPGPASGSTYWTPRGPHRTFVTLCGDHVDRAPVGRLIEVVSFGPSLATESRQVEPMVGPPGGRAGSGGT